MSPDFPIIVADESVDARITEALAEQGYAIFSIARECPGIPDIHVMDIAAAKKGFILTEDKDFGDLLIYKTPHLKIPGLLLRLLGLPIQERKNRVLHVFEVYQAEMQQGFSVLSPHKFRNRKFD